MRRGFDEIWVDALTQLVRRDWGLEGSVASPYLQVVRFELAPADLAGEIRAALRCVRTEGVVLIIVHSAIGLDVNAVREGVHEFEGRVRLVAQSMARCAPFDRLGPLWLGAATGALEKVAPMRKLLSRISAPRFAALTGLEARTAALVALELGTTAAADGLHHLDWDDLSPEALKKIQALWRRDLAQLTILKGDLDETVRRMAEADDRAARAERALEIARADHRANIVRLTKPIRKSVELAAKPALQQRSRAKTTPVSAASSEGEFMK